MTNPSYKYKTEYDQKEMWWNTSMNQFSFKFKCAFLQYLFLQGNRGWLFLRLISQISFYESALKLEFFITHNAGENYSMIFHNQSEHGPVQLQPWNPLKHIKRNCCGDEMCVCAAQSHKHAHTYWCLGHALGLCWDDQMEGERVIISSGAAEWCWCVWHLIVSLKLWDCCNTVRSATDPSTASGIRMVQ